MTSLSLFLLHIRAKSAEICSDTCTLARGCRAAAWNEAVPLRCVCTSGRMQLPDSAAAWKLLSFFQEKEVNMEIVAWLLQEELKYSVF